jgi:hypothetical protein|tara:strand:- start:497 stop:718 length:222 start_codon:yes stop_codon:yes gene_type:complete
MTEYTKEVQSIMRKQAVETWAAQCQYILGEKGYIEKAYNSGLITREYRDGRVETIEESRPMATLLLEAPNNIL